MTIILNDDVEKWVAELVRNGFYSSADEAVNGMLAEVRHSELGELPDAVKIQELRDELRVAIDEADRGDFVEFTAQDIIAEGQAARAMRTGK